MPEFLDFDKEPDDQTFLLYGSMGCGKTRLAATFPRPRFLSDAVEKGYETVRRMDKSLFFDPSYDVAKNIAPIRSMKDFRDGVMEAKADFAKDKFSTLVIDSLTFLGDLYLDANKEVADKRQVYGNLLTMMRAQMIEIHKIGCRVVWLALDKRSDDGYGGIQFAGQTAEKFPAACMYVFHMSVKHDRNSTTPPVYQLFTRQDGIFPCKTRDEKLPPVVENPSFRKLCELSGWTIPKK